VQYYAETESERVAYLVKDQFDEISLR